MKNKENYRWIIPSLIALGIALLSGGIFVGIKNYESLEASNNKIEGTNDNLYKNGKIDLYEHCQIWFQEKDEIPVMLETITDELLNKTEAEIKEILKEKYPDKEISTINKYQIILKNSNDITDVSKANKYTLEDEDGYISVFKYNKNGKKELIEKTSISIESLPKSVQNQIKEVIILDSEDQAYSRLEDFGS